MACAVAASAGAPAAVVACAALEVAATAGAEAVAPDGRADSPPDVSRITATVMMAISATASTTVMTMPPMAGRGLRGGLAVSNCETLLGSVLLIALPNFRSGQREVETICGRLLDLTDQVV